ncbi:hypothetical protein FJY90_00095 [Candidatus Gottesmanbacteria bacterium]|nr:hypothetical protein [Candidatus Gottesmanbacteria bacterium]
MKTIKTLVVAVLDLLGLLLLCEGNVEYAIRLLVALGIAAGLIYGWWRLIPLIVELENKINDP